MAAPAEEEKKLGSDLNEDDEDEKDRDEEKVDEEDDDEEVADDGDEEDAWRANELLPLCWLSSSLLFVSRGS